MVAHVAGVAAVAAAQVNRRGFDDEDRKAGPGAR